MELFDLGNGGVLPDERVEQIPEGRPLLVLTRELRQLNTRQNRARRLRRTCTDGWILHASFILQGKESVQEQALLREGFPAGSDELVMLSLELCPVCFEGLQTRFHQPNRDVGGA